MTIAEVTGGEERVITRPQQLFVVSMRRFRIYIIQIYITAAAVERRTVDDDVYRRH